MTLSAPRRRLFPVGYPPHCESQRPATGGAAATWQRTILRVIEGHGSGGTYTRETGLVPAGSDRLETPSMMFYPLRSEVHAFKDGMLRMAQS